MVDLCDDFSSFSAWREVETFEKEVNVVSAGEISYFRAFRFLEGPRLFGDDCDIFDELQSMFENNPKDPKSRYTKH